MARQWIKERKTALDTQSHRCTKWEIFPYPLNHFRQARKAFHSETEIISFLHPLSPHIPKSTKYANHSPSLSSLPAEGSPPAQLETMPGATPFSQHHGRGCPSVAVQKVWQTCSDSTVHRGGSKEEEVQCTFSPFHDDFFRIIFYSNASFPLLLFLEGTVYYICLGLKYKIIVLN